MVTTTQDVADYLAQHHYLGPSRRGWAWRTPEGVMVFAHPSSRRLPSHWLELVRWCLSGKPNDGTRQWSEWVRWAQDHLPSELTTVISYSDPSQGHTGALYRACGWLWAPTWHRLRPPPTGNGDWGTGRQAVKDRWVFPLRPDPERGHILAVKDRSVLRRMPWAQYTEPLEWSKNGWPIGGGGDYRRWREQAVS